MSQWMDARYNLPDEDREIEVHYRHGCNAQQRGESTRGRTKWSGKYEKVGFKPEGATKTYFFLHEGHDPTNSVTEWRYVDQEPLADWERELLYGADNPAPGKDNMFETITVAAVGGGYRGQIYYGRTNTIVWESEVQHDDENLGEPGAKNASQKALAAANDKLNSVVANLFAEPAAS